MFTVLEMSNTTRPKAEPKYVTYDYFQQQLKSIDNATKQYTRTYINNTVSAIQSNVVNYSALSNQSKSLTDGVRTIDFDSITQSIQFRTNINQTTTPIKIHPITNTINNVSKINFNDNSTITGITSDSSNTDPTKAISANILTGLNSRFTALETKTQNQTATENETVFTGNVTVNTINGYSITETLKNITNASIPVVRVDGVFEIRNFLDFHYLDYSDYCRLKYDNNKLQCNRTFTATNVISAKGDLNNIADRTKKLETKNTEQDTRLTNIETKNTEQDTRLTNIETKNTEQDTRLSNLETKTQNQTATENETVFTGNVTADTFNGFHLGFNNEFYTIPAIPIINSDLVMEVGRYIDFHKDTNTSTDYAARIYFAKTAFHISNSTILDTGDIKARNCIANGGDLNDIASRTKSLESKNTEQDTRLTNIETKNTEQDTRLTNIETKNTEQDTRLTNIETTNTEQDTRLTNIETTNTEQDTRLTNIETNTIPSINQILSNLQKADGILHEESVRYYDYSREHIEEIENTKIPAINTKNTEQDTRLSKLESKISNLLNSIYPVGSIYLSLTKSPPSLGGTWELIDEGKFLYSTTSTSGETGGSLHHTHATSGHVLTVGEMPMHKHTFNGNKITGAVYDIMKYDTTGQTNKEPEGAFSVNRYGSRTWQGKDGGNRAFSFTFEATPTGSISYEGNNQAHTHGNTEAEYHIPPYITCFMYKRTG